MMVMMTCLIIAKLDSSDSSFPFVRLIRDHFSRPYYATNKIVFFCLYSSFEYFGKQMDSKNFELNSNIHFQNLVLSFCSSLLLLQAHILIQNWTSDYVDSGFKRNIKICYQVFVRLR